MQGALAACGAATVIDWTQSSVPAHWRSAAILDWVEQIPFQPEGAPKGTLSAPDNWSHAAATAFQFSGTVHVVFDSPQLHAGHVIVPGTGSAYALNTTSGAL